MRSFFCKLASLLFLLQLLSCSSVPEIEIEGRVRLVGTDMFSSVIISTEDDKDFYFDETLFDEFQAYQNETIKIRAKIKEVELELADGSRKFVMQIIYEAEIIKD